MSAARKKDEFQALVSRLKLEIMGEVNKEILRLVRKRNGEVSTEREQRLLAAEKGDNSQGETINPDSPGTQIQKVRSLARKKIISPDVNFKIQLTN